MEDRAIHIRTKVLTLDQLAMTPGNVGYGQENDPLCPLLPSVKRNKDNLHAMYLDNKHKRTRYE